MTDPFTTLDGTFEQVWQRLRPRGRRPPRACPPPGARHGRGRRSRGPRRRPARGRPRGRHAHDPHRQRLGQGHRTARKPGGRRFLVLGREGEAPDPAPARDPWEIVEGRRGHLRAPAPTPPGRTTAAPLRPATPIPDPRRPRPRARGVRFAILLAHVREIETLHLGHASPPRAVS